MKRRLATRRRGAVTDFYDGTARGGGANQIMSQNLVVAIICSTSKNGAGVLP